LMLMLLLVNICSVLVVAYLGYSNGRSALRANIEQTLVSMNITKTDQIESYFSTVRSQARVLSEDLTVVEAMRQFKAAIPELAEQKPTLAQIAQLRTYYETEFIPRLTAAVAGRPSLDTYMPIAQSTRYLQYHYIATNPNETGEKDTLTVAAEGSQYSTVHQRFHPLFREILREYGYYDLFLIDAVNGQILYTVDKEVDFGMSLLSGVYTTSHLATAYDTALGGDRGFVTLTDFARYRASYGAPAAFVASPIYDGPNLIGVLALQLSTDQVNQVMTSNQKWAQVGLQTTGETYLVGEDYTLRSDARLLIEEPERYGEVLRSTGMDDDDLSYVDALNTSVLVQRTRSPGVVQAFEESASGVELTEDSFGNRVLRAYAPLDISDIDLVSVSEISQDEAFASIHGFTRRLVISIAALALIITLLSIWLSSLFLKPIRALSAGFQKLSDGDLNAHVKIQSRDELGALGQVFNGMLHTLKKTTRQIEVQNEENEALLRNVLPDAIAQRLKRGERNIADRFSNVTVLFCDIVNFQSVACHLSAEESVQLLNEIFTSFDASIDTHGVEKIKTSSSEYIAVSGLSIPCLDHAKRLVDFAVEMTHIVSMFNRNHSLSLHCRIGLHSGEVIAGVVGERKYTYDIWGETVSTAYYVQAQGKLDQIQVTRQVSDRLVDIYECQPSGTLECKGRHFDLLTVTI
ncbi:MAG: adenylate/guanylate cyclase domain-containing protein, partial [Cyanobacteria bacterium J06629_9]